MNQFTKALYVFNPEADFDACGKICRKYNIGSIVTNPYIYELEKFQQAMKDNNIDIIYNFPVFCNTEYLAAHPENYCITSKGRRATGAEWLHFVCPLDENHFSMQKEHVAKILEAYNPETFTFDFIRFYVFWEMADPGADPAEIEDGCYCDRCLDSFQKDTGVELKERSKKWIFQNVRDAWGKWKTEVITGRLGELTGIVRSHNPETRIGIKMVPWLESDFSRGMINIVGQDAEKIARHVDFFATMSYTHMTGHQPEKIHSLVDELNRKTGKPVLASVQIAKTYRDEPITEEEFRRQLQAAVKEPSEGFTIFEYDQLSVHEEMGIILSSLEFS